jgi:hypothetical protein
MSMSRKTLLWTAAGVVVAVATLIYAIWSGTDSGDDRAQAQSGSGNVQGGDNSINAGRDIVIHAEQLKEETRGMTRQEAEQAASRYAEVNPVVGQANPYLVIEAPSHLWVRSSGTVTGYHIGAAHNGSLVWVDCVATTDFDPELTDTTGPVWLRVRWPTDQPNDDIKSSQPSDRYVGWVYSRYTVPAGHNGRVPAC